MRKSKMDEFSNREIEWLAALKEKPMEFETYPPVYQTRCFVEYLVRRGVVSFTAKNIQDMFRHAQLKKALADKPNLPSPSVIRKYINNATRDGKLPLRYEESSERWLVQYPVFRIFFTVEVQANDAFQAKDAVRTKVAFGNQIVDESVTSSKPWVVTFELATKFTSRVSVWGELIELMSATARDWSVRLSNGNMEVESTGNPKIGRFKKINVKLCQIASA